MILSYSTLRSVLVVVCLLVAFDTAPSRGAIVTFAFEAELFGVPVRPGNTFRTGQVVQGSVTFDTATTPILAGSPPPFTAFYNNAIVRTEMSVPFTSVTAQGTGGTIIVGDNQQFSGSSSGLRDAFETFGQTSGTEVFQFNELWEIDRVGLFFDKRVTFPDTDFTPLDEFTGLDLPTDVSQLQPLTNQRVNISMSRLRGGSTIATAVTGTVTSLTQIVPEPSSSVLLLPLAMTCFVRCRWNHDQQSNTEKNSEAFDAEGVYILIQ